MKRLFILLISVLVLITGCVRENTAETTRFRYAGENSFWSVEIQGSYQGGSGLNGKPPVVSKDSTVRLHYKGNEQDLNHIDRIVLYWSSASNTNYKGTSNLYQKGVSEPLPNDLEFPIAFVSDFESTDDVIRLDLVLGEESHRIELSRSDPA